MGDRVRIYVCEAADSLDSLESDGCSVITVWDTLKEAKARAKYYCSDECANGPLGYARVLCNGEVVWDYFRKG